MNSPTPEQRLAARSPTAQDRPVLYQRWEHLLFLHWEADPQLIARRLPPGLRVDLDDDGKTYLGLVPFQMAKVRPRFCPPLPWLSWFPELNVRAYVYDEATGAPGVWFFSLDADQPVAVEVARRWYHLPYQHAEMRCEVADEGTEVRYRCLRKGRPEDERARFEYRCPGAGEGRTADPGTLEFFLLERYLLFSWDEKRRRLLRGQVEHEPYRFLAGSDLVDAFSASPLRWNGFGGIADGAPCHVASARPVDVTAYAVRPAGG